MTDPAEMGPLGPLVGTWEGDQGLDIAWSHERGKVHETPYRQTTTLNPFDLENGTQKLFGLDYRMAAWRGDETDPFHTEIGYWLWDPTDSKVFMCAMVPRGTVWIAGGDADANTRSLRLHAETGKTDLGVLNNPYLYANARVDTVEVSIEIGEDEWTYEYTTTLAMAHLDEPLAHTDKNTLKRVKQ